MNRKHTSISMLKQLNDVLDLMLLNNEKKR